MVDPEWLQSNDEEARALRQAMEGRPNKTWRVLHRVTYVERPALLGIGVDRRPVGDDEIEGAAVSYFDSLEKKNKAMQGDIKNIINQIAALSQKIDSLG